MARGPAAGATEIARIRALPGLERYFLLHMTAGEFARRLGDHAVARAHYDRAATFEVTEPEQRFLARRLAEIS
jgi:RNA polymerase sigma-70 factor (ECF subfamily)